MRKLGLNPQQLIGAPNGIRIIDLYGELEGTDKAAPQILVMAHYDSTPNGPGAADDSTGVAVALETIRALKATGPLRNAIGVLLTDGEEVHGVCLGANFFVNNETNRMRNLKLVVNLEARGNHGPALMFQTGPNNNGIVRLFGAACPLPVAASFSEDVYRHMPNDTDLTEFLNAGKRGLNFAFTAGIEFYHAPQDTPENLSQRTLQHYGACILPVVKNLGEANTAAIDRCLEPGDATFFTICRGKFVRYPAWVSTILAIVSAIAFIAALCVGVADSRLRIRWVAIAFAATILAVVIAAVLGVGVVFFVTHVFSVRVNLPFIVGTPFSSLLLLGIVVAALSITLILKARLLRHANDAEQIAGGLSAWVALMLVTNSALAGATYLFTWPALFGTLALFVYCPRDSRARSVLFAVLTCAPAPLLLAPTILLIHETITIGTAPLSAALVALAVCLMPWRSGALAAADLHKRS
jgi:hypothetical protein